jgi:LiaI-LiaF-like transmembrane region/Cell wall-active antibiotics response LiaF, C-terminal
MDTQHNRGGLVGPILLIGLGVTFLLVNLGMLSPSIWGVLLRIWPVILIAIGIDLLIGRRSILGRLLALVLILGVLAGGLWLGGVRIGSVQRGERVEGEAVSQALGGATRGQVSVDPAVGMLQVGALAAGSANLAEGDVALPAGAHVTKMASVSGGTARLSLSMNGSWYGPSFNDNSMKWTLDLNRDVPLDLHFSLIAGEGVLDLSKLKVEALDVSSVFGQTKATLPAGNYRAHISGVFGQTIVSVPANAGVKVKVSAVFGSSSVPSGYSRQGDWFYSPNYSSAATKIELTADEVFGQVTVR